MQKLQAALASTARTAPVSPGGSKGGGSATGARASLPGGQTCHLSSQVFWEHLGQDTQIPNDRWRALEKGTGAKEITNQKAFGENHRGDCD